MGEWSNADWRWLADNFDPDVDTTWDEDGASGYDFTPHTDTVWLPPAPSGEKYLYMPDLAIGRKLTVTAQAMNVSWPDIRFRVNWDLFDRVYSGLSVIVGIAGTRASSTNGGWDCYFKHESDGQWGIELGSYINSSTSRSFIVNNITAPTTDADGWVWIRVEAVDGGNDNVYTSTDGSTWGTAVASAAGWTGASSLGSTDGLFGTAVSHPDNLAITDIVVYEQGDGSATFHWRAQDHSDILTAETSYVGGATVTPVGSWARGYHPVLMTDECAAWAGDGYMHHTMANSPALNADTDDFTYVAAVKEFDLSATDDTNLCDLFRHFSADGTQQYHLATAIDGASDEIWGSFGRTMNGGTGVIELEEWVLYALTRDNAGNDTLWKVTASGATSLDTTSSGTLLDIGGTSRSLEFGSDSTNRTRHITTGMAIWGDTELTQSELAGLWSDIFGAGAANAIVGDVTVSVTPASTMTYGVGIVGDVTTTLTPSATMTYGVAIIGDTTVTFVPAAVMSAGANAIIGDITVTVVPAAVMSYNAGCVLSIDWGTRVITVPRCFMTDLGGDIYQLDLGDLHLALKDILDDEEGIAHPDTHFREDSTIIGGVEYAPKIIFINGYSIYVDPATAYQVSCTGANSNIQDVYINTTGPTLLPNNSAGQIVTGESGLTQTEALDLELLRKFHTNDYGTDPATGEIVLMDDDGVTPIKIAKAYEDYAKQIAFRGQGVSRREGFADPP